MPWAPTAPPRGPARLPPEEGSTKAFRALLPRRSAWRAASISLGHAGLAGGATRTQVEVTACSTEGAAPAIGPSARRARSSLGATPFEEITMSGPEFYSEGDLRPHRPPALSCAAAPGARPPRAQCVLARASARKPRDSGRRAVTHAGSRPDLAAHQRHGPRPPGLHTEGLVSLSPTQGGISAPRKALLGMSVSHRAGAAKAVDAENSHRSAARVH